MFPVQSNALFSKRCLVLEKKEKLRVLGKTCTLGTLEAHTLTMPSGRYIDSILKEAGKATWGTKAQKLQRARRNGLYGISKWKKKTRALWHVLVFLKYIKQSRSRALVMHAMLRTGLPPEIRELIYRMSDVMPVKNASYFYCRKKICLGNLATVDVDHDGFVYFKTPLRVTATFEVPDGANVGDRISYSTVLRNFEFVVPQTWTPGTKVSKTMRYRPDSTSILLPKAGITVRNAFISPFSLSDEQKSVLLRLLEKLGVSIAPKDKAEVGFASCSTGPLIMQQSLMHSLVAEREHRQQQRRFEHLFAEHEAVGGHAVAQHAAELARNGEGGDGSTPPLPLQVFVEHPDGTGFIPRLKHKGSAHAQ